MGLREGYVRRLEISLTNCCLVKMTAIYDSYAHVSNGNIKALRLSEIC